MRSVKQVWVGLAEGQGNFRVGAVVRVRDGRIKSESYRVGRSKI